VSWRYQAVYSENADGVRSYSICEVYFDDDGKLTAWTESMEISPYGSSLEELVGDLDMMREDIKNWESVPVGGLEVGMGFVRRCFDSQS